MIKTKTITTDKATLLVVELPEGAYYPNICQLPPNIGVNCFLYENGVNTPYKEPLGIPKGNWQLLGRIPDITEGYVYDLIPEVTTPIMGFKAYPNFYKDEYCKTSLDSLYSLLQVNEVYFENSLGEEPKITSGEYDDNGFGDIDKYQFKRDLKSWQEAQSKVWDKERCYIFIKVD